MKKRLLAYILSLVMLVSLIPTAATAAGGEPSVYVGNTKIDANTYYVVSGDGEAQMASAYSPEGKPDSGYLYLSQAENGTWTLEMNNFEYSGKEYYNKGLENGALYLSIPEDVDLTINLTGENRITPTAGGVSTSRGICINAKSSASTVTFTSSSKGSLYARGCDLTASNKDCYSYGISAEYYSDGCNIAVSGSAQVSAVGGSVTAEGETSKGLRSYGLYMKGALTVSNEASLTAQGGKVTGNGKGDATSQGLFCGSANGKKALISDRASLTANGGDVSNIGESSASSYGMWSRMPLSTLTQPPSELRAVM